jgi:hypothetical protein
VPDKHNTDGARQLPLLTPKELAELQLPSTSQPRKAKMPTSTTAHGDGKVIRSKNNCTQPRLPGF